MYRLWEDLSVQELVLGTAQWGFGYGVTNIQSRLSDAVLEQIMAVFESAGHTRVDTAQGYGDAQLRLRPWAQDLSVTSKVKGRGLEASWEREFSQCLNELGIGRLNSCLLHDWYDLDDDEKQSAVRGLERARQAEFVQYVGISAYDDLDLESAARFFTNLDVVQLPANVLDRLFEDSLARVELSGAGTTFQVRSVFLQGLLCAPTSLALGEHPSLKAFFEFCNASGRKPLEVALSHIKALSWVDQVVIGVTSSNELQETLDNWQKAEPLLGNSSLKTNDANVIDPRTWPANQRLKAI